MMKQGRRELAGYHANLSRHLCHTVHTCVNSTFKCFKLEILFWPYLTYCFCYLQNARFYLKVYINVTFLKTIFSCLLSPSLSCCCLKHDTGFGTDRLMIGCSALSPASLAIVQLVLMRQDLP